MKAFLHIGTEKTGTTTIQHFLAKNRENLLRQGYLYPSSPGKITHTKLVLFALEATKIQDIHKLHGFTTPEKVKLFKTKFKPKLIKEIKSIDVDKVIFSSEHCSSRLISKEQIKELKTLLDEVFEDIEIIIYLRRQDKFLSSSYSTAIKAGATFPFKIPSQEIIENRYNYYNLIRKFASIFGDNKIRVRLFESTEMLEGNLIKDFLNLLDLKLDNSYESVENLNTSLDVYCLEYIRLMTLLLGKFGEIQKTRYRNKLLTKLEEYSHQDSRKKATILSEEMARNFMLNFDESNKKIAEMYLHRTDRQLFNDNFSGLRKHKISNIAMTKKLLEITGFLIKDKLTNW